MRVERLALFLALFVFAAQAAAGKKKEVDPRLARVQTVFVAGNNKAASNARKLIPKWTCFRVVASPQTADAVFEFRQELREGSSASTAGAQRAFVAATLTTRDGHLIWSKVASNHADFINTAGSSAVRKVLFSLQHDAFPHVGNRFGGVDRGGCPNEYPRRGTRRRRFRPRYD